MHRKSIGWMEKWENRKDLIFPHVCLVGGVEKWEGEKLFCLVGEKKRETENGEENNPFGPTLLPPYLGGKDADDVIYTNTLTLLPSPTPLIFPLLYYKDIIINLYKLHFSSSPFLSNQTKKNFTLPLFHPSNQTHMRENQIFSILPLFHSAYWFSMHHQYIL